MIVSVFTDASFHLRFKAAGWGCWVKSDRGSFERGGPVKSDVGDVNTAEFLALANGLHVACLSPVVQFGDKIIAQTDNSHVVGVMQGKDWKMTPMMHEARQTINGLLSAQSLRLEVRHVPGHREGKPRYVVNNRADELARRGLASAISRRQS